MISFLAGHGIKFQQKYDAERVGRGMRNVFNTLEPYPEDLCISIKEAAAVVIPEVLQAQDHQSLCLLMIR